MSPPFVSAVRPGYTVMDAGRGLLVRALDDIRAFRECGSSAGYLVCRSVADARRHEIFDRRYGLDAAPSADAGTVERRCGAGKIELTLQRPILKKRIDKSGVENVTSAGSVNDLNLIGGGVVEARAVPGEYAFVT